jgi:hypothetical protein
LPAAGHGSLLRSSARINIAPLTPGAIFFAITQ